MSKLKKILWNRCVDLVRQRMSHTEEAIRLAQTSANEEEKSSSGDKYETGRAMAQLEAEKNYEQRHESGRLMEILNRINPSLTGESATLGSLVTTDKGNFFLAVSLGQTVVDDVHYQIISVQTPVGKKMIGLRSGDTFEHNAISYTILRLE